MTKNDKNAIVIVQNRKLIKLNVHSKQGIIVKFSTAVLIFLIVGVVVVVFAILAIPYSSKNFVPESEFEFHSKSLTLIDTVHPGQVVIVPSAYCPKDEFKKSGEHIVFCRTTLLKNCQNVYFQRSNDTLFIYVTDAIFASFLKPAKKSGYVDMDIVKMYEYCFDKGII